MRLPMTYEECCSGNHFIKVQPDIEKVNSMVKLADIRLSVLKNVSLDDETASIIAVDYYEVIKELLTALLLKNGIKSDNHECLVAHFRMKYPESEYESTIIQKLKEVRNKVSYYGVFVKKDYIEMSRLEFEHIIKLLKELILK